MIAYSDSIRFSSICRFLFVFAPVMAFLTSGAMADGFRNPVDGAKAMGRGGVRLTEAQDPSAMIHNPANMMDPAAKGASIGANIGYSTVKYTAPNGLSEKSDDPWKILPSAFFVWPSEKGDYATGIGINYPYGQSTTWDENGIFRGFAPYFAEMMCMNLTPSAAIKLAEKVSLGVGVNVMWSQLEFRQVAPWGSRLVFDGDGVGFGANVGLTWQMTSKQRVALTYRTPSSVNYEGDFTMVNPPPPGVLPPMATARSEFESDIDFPGVAMLGYGIHLTDALRLEANVEWIQHSRNESIDLDIANNNFLFGAPGGGSLPQDWKDTWAVGLGADYALNETWTLRGGWYYMPTPIPDRNLMNTLPENDMNVFGVGVGYKRNGQMVDVGYVYNLMSDRTVANSAVPGAYEFESHLLSISYAYSF